MDECKPFLTIDEQIKKLTDRGLPIQEHEYEKLESFLLFNNYYRISGYSLSMRNNDVFTDDASVDKLIQIYETDRRMRHIMLSALEIIEVKIKS